MALKQRKSVICSPEYIKSLSASRRLLHFLGRSIRQGRHFGLTFLFEPPPQRRYYMPDLSFSTTQLQALHTLFLSQGSNLPEELKLLLGSLQIQLEGNFSSNPSFPTPSPSPERPSKAARATKYLSIKTRPNPPWLASKSRTTCEAGIQVDLDLAAQVRVKFFLGFTMSHSTTTATLATG